MPGILETLQKIDTVKLSGHLEIANGSVSVSGQASLGGLDPRELLGELGTLMKSAEGFATDPKKLVESIVAELGDLGKLIDIPAAASVADVAAMLDQLVKLLEQALQNFGGDPSALIDKLLGGGGLEKVAQDLMQSMIKAIPLQIPGEVQSVLKAITGLIKGTPPNAQDLAGTLCQILIGLDLGALQAPGLHIGEFLGKIGKAGGDFAPVQFEMRTLTVQIRGVSTMLLEPQVDLAGAGAALARIKGSLDLFMNNTLAGAIAKFTTDLAALDPGAAVEKLRALLRPLESRVSSTLFDLEQDMVAPLRSLAKMVENLTPEQLVARFEGFVDQLKESMQDTGIDELLSSIDGLFDALVHQIQRVPLRRLRRELLEAMASVEEKILSFPGFTMPGVLTEQARKMEDAIAKVDTTAIQQKVDEFTAKINSVLDAFPIEEIKNEISGLIDAVRQALDQFKPVLADLEKQLEALAQQVEAIDFSQAGKQSVDLMKGIREDVQAAIGSGDVPDPAKAAIGIAAQALEGINVRVEISKPFDAALATLDAKAVLAPIDPVMAKFSEVIGMVTPQALIEKLDEPFNQLLAALGKLKPAALLAGLSSDFAGFMDLVSKLDPRALIAPLEAEFQKLVKKLRDAADPAPLFAPLRAGYKKVQELIDLIDLEKLFGKMLDRLSQLPMALQDGMQSAVAQHVPGGVGAQDAAGRDLKFGDIIRPIGAMLGLVQSKVAKLAEELAGEAMRLLAGPLAALRQLASAGNSFFRDVVTAIERRQEQIDIFALSGPAVELRAALHELKVISGGLSAGAQLQIGPGVAAIQLDAHVGLINGPVAGMGLASAGVQAKLNPPDLAVALRKLNDTLQRLIPGPLLAPQAGAAVSAILGDIFESFNVEPLALEMDHLGEAIQAKFASMMNEIAAAISKVWTLLLDFVSPLMPIGLVKRMHAGMDKIRAEIAVLDPAVIEAEVGEILDAVVSVMNRFSPLSLADQLGGIFDGIKTKMGALNPATLLGNLDPIAAVITKFETLRPSVVLKPLADSTKDLTAALGQLTSIGLGGPLISAAEKLKAQLSVIIDGLEQELQALLDFLKGLAGGGVSVSVSASASFG